MANYSQSPYGMPFPPHAQPFLPQTPTAAPNGQPSTGDSFHYNGNSAGLNLQHYVPSPQQQQQYPYWPVPPPSAYSTGPLPPPFTPPFMTQNGVLPPPPLGSNFYSPVSPLPPQGAPTPTQLPYATTPYEPQHPLLSATNQRITEVSESEKEDGEVSEGDGSGGGTGMGIVRHEPPRSAPFGHWKEGRGDFNINVKVPISAVPTRERYTNGTASNVGITPPSGPPPEQPNAPAIATNVLSTSPQPNLDQQRAAAEQFVKLLQENKIGYPTLLSEGLEAPLLSDMFNRLHLPLHPAHAAPLGVPNQNANGNAIKSAPVKLTASPVEGPKVQNRDSYVAALKAARTSKAAATSAAASIDTKAIPAKSASPPVAPVAQSVVTSFAPVIPAPSPDAATKLDNSKLPVTQDLKAQKTELARQRLEAFKAKRAAALQAQNTAPNSTVASPRSAQDVQSTENSVQQSPSTIREVPPQEKAESFDKRQPPKAPATTTSFSSIPGLFMTASTRGTSAAPSTSRKRPVASDFNELSSPRKTGILYTRPLGQYPHEHDTEPMVIEVSEDESEDSDMELDGEPSVKRREVSSPDSSLYGQPNPQAQLNRSDFASVSFTSAAHTPSGAQTPNGSQHKEKLEQAEKDIAKMKREIALREELKRKLAAQASLKPPQFPAKPGSTEAKRPAAKQSALNATVQDTSVSRVVSSPVQPAALLTDADWKQRRRADVDSQLFGLENKLAGIRMQEVELERQIQEARTLRDEYIRDKEALVKELEGLRQDLSSTLYDNESLNVVRQGSEASSQAQTPDKDSNGPTQDISSTVAATDPGQQRSRNADNSERSQDLEIPLAQPSTVKQHSPTMTSQHSPQSQTKVPSDTTKPSKDHQPHVTAPDPGRFDSNGVATPVDDEEDFYSPEPTILEEANHLDKNTEPLDTTNAPSEEGEVEMSESPDPEDEDYEPMDTQPSLAPVVQPLDNDAAGNPAASIAASIDDEEDIYEPSEPGQILPDTQTNPADKLFAANELPPHDDDPGAMDISMSSSDSNLSESSPEPVHHESISSNNRSRSSVAVADYHAPEMQSQTVSASQDVTGQEDSALNTERPVFVPYESPLRMFKSYRYHPNYSQEVPGSFQSLTYSHQIDPQKQLCRFESVGGTCNDPQCDGQHFRGMGLTGEKILVQLGTANPGKTNEEKQQWNDGLRLVLKELRQKNIKDPNGIAVEIAKYRRQFLNDDTRVVNL